MIALGVLGFVLVAVPLYLWRRPRAVPIEATGEALGATAALADAAAPAPSAAGGARVSDAVVLECHDPGPNRTPPEQCGRLPGFEKAFARAVADAAACVAPGAGGGTIVYVADVSYGRPKARAVRLTLPKEGRTFKGGVSACESAVERALKAAPLDADHGHSRYKLEVTATYP